MIRHQVYFDTLGSMKEDTASWRSVFAGLSVLRLVDAYIDADPGPPAVNWAQLHSVRTALSEVAEGDPVRGVLTNLVDEVEARNKIDDAVCVALLAYGRALDYEASWGLATDVFSTVAKLARPEKNARLAVEANVAIGGAARRNGDWDTSARAYSQAAYIADTLGDRKGVLTVQVGIANNYLAKGNLPQARVILDDVLMQARELALTEVEAIALHSRSSLEQKQGDYKESVKLAYEALGLTPQSTARDFLLADLAASLSEIGMLQAARDAQLILAATSQTRWVAWQATINLMELASKDGDVEAFDSDVSELSRANLGPIHRAYFMLFRGEGLARFEKFEAAEECLRTAVEFAAENQLNQVAFQAESALSALRSQRHRAKPAPSPFVDTYGELSSIALGLSQLREAASTASAK